MDIQTAYNTWAEQYDTNVNKTRDLEATALRAMLARVPFDECLEVGCGTGKNTAWLVTKAKAVTALDFSEEMLAKAREKVDVAQVQFVQADLTQDWDFVDRPYDMAVFSLVLEHVEDLVPIFKKLSGVIRPQGHVYVGELHPFKQYTGSKARFNTAAGQQTVTCFNHHLSDFTSAAKQYGFRLVDVGEHFDDDDRSNLPRVLTLLFRKD